MADDQISDAALARRQAFVKAKEEAGGIDALVNQTKNYKLYFDKEGNIVCFTSSDGSGRFGLSGLLSLNQF